MAILLPFRALHYDPAKAGSLASLVTQPYDKITPEMQKQYLRESPHNLVRLVKGEVRPQDTSLDNVYPRAKEYLRSWQGEGVLQQSSHPAFYCYYQKFSDPRVSSGAVLTRKGFIALGRLERYDSGIVFRHEQTLSGPKLDRLELLRATRTHLESIMMLYSDPERRIEQLLDRQGQRSPDAEVQDEYGVQHSLWQMQEPGEIAELQQAMADKKLIIADGHHRYETALTFERECRTHHAPSGTQPSLDLPTIAEPDCSFALMTYFNMEGDGIVILPTHRVLAGLPAWNRNEVLAQVAQYFVVERLPFSDAGSREAALGRMQQQMQRASAEGVLPVIGALFHDDTAFYTLAARADVAWDRVLAGLTAAQRSLDVNVLHRVVLGSCLGLDDESVRRESNIRYVRQFAEGIEPVLQGSAQACFFLSPARIEQVRDIAFAGQLLPQKSTDFYPKLLSGLVMYPLNH